MGRQFRFFILPADANQLVEELQKRFGARLLLDYSPTRNLFEIELPYQRNSEGVLKTAAPNSRLRYYLASLSGRVDRSYHPKPDRWVIDGSSEAIEFCGCDMRDDYLEIGRFYYQADVLVNMEILPKRPEFVGWAERVFRSAKSLLQYEPALMAYVGKEAIKFRKQGGQFVTGRRPDGTMIPA
jgi:hypothetical protein